MAHTNLFIFFRPKNKNNLSKRKKLIKMKGGAVGTWTATGESPADNPNNLPPSYSDDPNANNNACVPKTLDVALTNLCATRQYVYL